MEEPGWLVPCSDLLQTQNHPDELDRRYSLGLQDYDSNVGLRSLDVAIDHAALEMALGDLLDTPKRCAAMGEAGRKRIESFFAWQVVSSQYRDLWHELEGRRAAHQNGDTRPWPMAHTARLFSRHASAPPSAGPWWLAEQGSDPNLLTDSHADLLSAAADPCFHPWRAWLKPQDQTERGGAMVGKK